MIKAIIFDCFGVLTSDKWKEFASTLPKNQREPARRLNRALDRGQLGQKEFISAINQLSGEPTELVEQIFSAEMPKNNQLLSYIRRLKANYKIALLSNVASNWVTDIFLDSEEISLFDEIVLSHHAGVAKPSAEIYQLTAERLGVRPDECVFIDDGLANCEGARAIGMQAILYEDLANMKQQLEKILADTNN